MKNKQKEHSHIFQTCTELLGNLAVSGMHCPEIVAFNQIYSIENIELFSQTWFGNFWGKSCASNNSHVFIIQCER